MKRIFSSGMKAALGARDVDVTSELLASLPRDFSGWSSLAQDQYLEIRTLLSSYILCSQGDPDALAGFTPAGRPVSFPRRERGQACSDVAAVLPWLHVLDEKHVLEALPPRGTCPRRSGCGSKQP